MYDTLASASSRGETRAIFKVGEWDPILPTMSAPGLSQSTKVE